MSEVVGQDLVNHPGLVLKSEIAYRIMSYGMRNGSFTGAKLSDFIGGPEADYVNARRIINGQDQARKIAGYAEKFEAILRASTSEPDHTLVRPIAWRLTPGSEFDTPDPEGAPSKDGKRYHAAKDWFAPGGTTVRAPVDGTIVEVERSTDDTGQVFGGTVKVRAKDGKVWVFRHVDPARVQKGQRVDAGDPIAHVTEWEDKPSSSHAHIELWKTLEGGYRFENMIDPMSYLERFL